MKALLLSMLVIVGLDEAFDHGVGVEACRRLAVHLVRGTERDVSESVYRR